MNPNEANQMRVGEVAAATGLTVRTLHHYDEVGLLRPSGRTAAGHRFYLAKDLERLLRIAAMRQLGLPLEQIGTCLDGPDGELLPVLERQLQTLDQSIAAQEQLRARIHDLVQRLRHDEELTANELMTVIEATTMFAKHFDPAQLEWLQQRKTTTGEDRIRAVEQEWPRLMAAVRDEMNRGTDPGAPTMQALAQRWQALVAEFTGGRSDIAAGVASVYRHEPRARQRTGLDAEIMAYVGRALGWR